ncbi:MAG TPA: class I SAM-dependent methyltransferase [Thermomicrobiales bacterium]
MHDDAFRYDLESSWFTDDLPYWEWLVETYRPRRVLDLACGTGRMTFPLARRCAALDPGSRVVGLDISEPLLDRARERLGSDQRELSGIVSFVRGDMANFNLGEQFDLIVIGFNSLAYVIGLENQISCLQSVRRHLAPGGRLAIDLLVPALRLLDPVTAPPMMHLELDLSAPEQGVQRMLRFATIRYNPETQVDRTLYVYEMQYTDGRQERFFDDLEWQMYFPRELELLMRLSGLKVVERYGAYDRQPFGPRSRQYLWIMEADSGA